MFNRKSLIALCFLLLASLISQVSAQSDLPSSGQQVTITSDHTISIPQGEVTYLSGNLTIQGSTGNLTNLRIIVDGTLVINGTITCNAGNLTLENRGQVTASNASFMSLQDSRINIINSGTCNITDTSFTASGNDTVYNIENSGEMRLLRTELTADEGVFNVNGLFGSFTFDSCKLRIIRNSSETLAAYNMINGYSNWTGCEIQNQGSFNYQNNGYVIMKNCRISTLNNGTTNLQNSGTLIFYDVNFTSQGSLNLASNGWTKLSYVNFDVYNRAAIYNPATLLTKFISINTYPWRSDESQTYGSFTLQNNGALYINQPLVEGVPIINFTSKTRQIYTQPSNGTVEINNIFGGINIQQYIYSCNTDGDQKNIFNPDETLCLQGVGFSASTSLPVHIVPAQSRWLDKTSLPNRIQGTLQTIITDNDGSITLTRAWNNTLPGRYDVIIDVNKNNVYDEEVDAVDGYEVEGSGGFMIVPEFNTATLTIALTILTLSILKVRKHNITQNLKQQP